ncbi:hypothetical protein OAP83_03070 [Rickettsiales bacterium]|nr:hypothetical protein [Rickettsiales bacterium]
MREEVIKDIKAYYQSDEFKRRFEGTLACDLARAKNISAEGMTLSSVPAL